MACDLPRGDAPRAAFQLHAEGLPVDEEQQIRLSRAAYLHRRAVAFGVDAGVLPHVPHVEEHHAGEAAHRGRHGVLQLVFRSSLALHRDPRAMLSSTSRYAGGVELAARLPR